jgi:hypothetical protein
MSNLKWLRPSAYRKELHGDKYIVVLVKKWNAKTDKFSYMVDVDSTWANAKSLDGFAKKYAEKGYRLMGFIPVPSGEQEFDGPEEKTPWEDGEAE